MADIGSGLNIILRTILSKTTEANLIKELKQIEARLPPTNINIKTNIEQIDKIVQVLNADMSQIQKQTTSITQESGKQLNIVQSLNVKTGELATKQNILIDNQKRQRLEAEKLLITENKLQQSILAFQTQTKMQMQNMQGKYGTLLDTNAIRKLRSELEFLSTKTPDVAFKMRMMALGLQQVETNARNSSKALQITQKESMSIGAAFKQAFEKFPKIYGKMIA